MNYKSRLLIVEDDIEIRNLISDIIANLNLTIFQAGDSDTALKIIQEYPIDIVLTDYRIPRINGLQLMLQAQNMGVTSLFVLLTAQKDQAIYLEAKQLGVNFILGKPFEPHHLLSQLRKAIQNCHSSQRYNQFLNQIQESEERH